MIHFYLSWLRGLAGLSRPVLPRQWGQGLYTVAIREQLGLWSAHMKVQLGEMSEMAAQGSSNVAAPFKQCGPGLISGSPRLQEQVEMASVSRAVCGCGTASLRPYSVGQRVTRQLRYKGLGEWTQPVTGPGARTYKEGRSWWPPPSEASYDPQQGTVPTPQVPELPSLGKLLL